MAGYSDWMNYNPSTITAGLSSTPMGWGVNSPTTPSVGTVGDYWANFNMFNNSDSPYNLANKSWSPEPMIGGVSASNQVGTNGPWGQAFANYNALQGELLKQIQGLGWVPYFNAGLQGISTLAGLTSAFQQAKDARKQMNFSMDLARTGYDNQAQMTREAMEARRGNQLAFGRTSTITQDDINNIKNV